MDIEFTLPIKPRTKKNSSSFVTLKNGRTILLPSKYYRAFEKEAVSYVESLFGNLEPIDRPINLCCVFYKDKNHISDLVGYLQAIQDTLVKAGLLKDDNSNIVASTDGSRVELDRENPRIEVKITWKEES